MIVLVVTATARVPWFGVAREHLASSNPGARVVPIWADGRIANPPPFDGIRSQRLEIDDIRYPDLVLAFGWRDAAWAALPWILETTDTDGPVVVIDDTVLVDGSLDDLLEGSGRDAVTRSRHRDDRTGLGWGGSLSGLLAIRQPDSPLLDWWRTRSLAALAGDDDLSGLWRDLPGDLVEAVVEPGWRLAWSTADELEVSAGSGLDRVPTVDGLRVKAIDLDGLDPSAPWWFAPDGLEPSRRLSDAPALRGLLSEAADELIAAGWSPSGHDDDPLVGVAATPSLRRWFRAELVNRNGTLPPNPYVAGEAQSFIDLLRGPGDPERTGISNYADIIWDSRPDLRAAFANVRWGDRDRFVDWLWTHGLRDGTTNAALLPGRAEHHRRPGVVVHEGERPFGVNLVGYLDADLGLGVAARRMLSAFEAAGVPVATVSYDRTVSRREPANLSDRNGARSVIDAPYRFNLLVITPDQLPFFVDDVGESFFAGRYNIGLWYWETDVLTEREQSSFGRVDEVWGSTKYLVDVFASYGRVPVSHVPVPLVFENLDVGPDDRERLGLDDRFTVLFSFDFLSVAERKNPFGLVEAYRMAFPGPDDGARLILKTINGDRAPRDLERLLAQVADRPDVEVWDRYISAGDRLALVAGVDCYASLHRSEGLGLTMAEAMSFGTPVIATAYSGNLDFMDDESALLVPATEIRVGPGHLYPADGHWADPDLDVAAAHLRRLRDDEALGRRLAEAGRRALAPFDTASVGAIAAARLRRIADGTGSVAPARTVRP